MATLLKAIVFPLAGILVLVLAMGGYFTVGALTRERPPVIPGTVHSQLSRESCAECHAPIAREWRESFHFQSVTGPYWERLRTKGFDSVFGALRMPCMNCHAPANVLDLTEGAHPVQRTDAVELGVDCVACHVSEQGIMGPGRHVEAPHEVIRDERFRDASLASTALCSTCHEEAGDCGKVVTEWQRTQFAADGVTCLHCHMPEITAPAVSGGPARRRRSHRFLGDKDDELLRAALNTSILLDDGQAVVRITNDRVGHSFPASGMNWLFVKLQAFDEGGRMVEEVDAARLPRLLAVSQEYQDPTRGKPGGLGRAALRSRRSVCRGSLSRLVRDHG
jgi:hypothetical protein